MSDDGLDNKEGPEEDERRNKRAKTEKTNGAELEKLRQELAKLQEETAKLQEENAKRAKTEKTNGAELEKLRQELAKLQEENAQNKEVSLHTLLTSPPEIVLKESGSGKSHTGESAHKKGRAEEKKFVLGLQQLVQSPHKSIAECWHNVNSVLLSSLRVPNPPSADDKSLSRSYATEADISSLVSAAVIDASYLAGKVTGMNFETRHETSLFAQRPDHLVVYNTSSGLPLLSVEDKKPWGMHVGVEGLETVVGQIFDYATAMRAFGNAAPFVVLTCFQKSLLFWLEDRESNLLATQESRRNESSFEKLRKKNLEQMDCRSDKKTPSPPDLKSVPPSPEKGATQILVGSNENCSTYGIFSGGGGDNARTLNYSRENGFDYKNLVPLLYTAILCAVKMNPNPQHLNRLKIAELSKGFRFEGGALKMKENMHDYEWGQLVATVGEKIKERNSSTRLKSLASEPCFFVVAIIGVGSTSKVFSALDQNGEPWVIKMYVKRTDNTGLNLDAKAFAARAKEKTEKEVKSFEALYPFLKGKVKHQMIIGFHCVIMPFFKPLTKTERPKKETEIKAVLHHFYEKNLQQDEVDLRWRHIGLYTDAETQEHLVLYDLADLKSIEGKRSDEGSAFVEQKWNILRGRLDAEETE